MDFYAILAQVLELLQRQGRVSYRALKVQFGLDDEQLEALKDELIEAQRLATDERGRVLVWIGVTAAQPDQPPQSVPSSPSLPSAEAERRQLTVLFCDLVDSTKLAQQLDPEDYRAVVRAYQEAAVTAMQPFEGYVAQYLGDGLLVYFGYPQAHEDAAQRVVRAGLAMVDAMAPLNTRLASRYGVRIAVRLGLHTGVVVVGSVGSGGRQEQLALGDTPNIAARLQGLAAPNTVVLSAATVPLLHGAFALEDVGVQQLRGVAEPLAVYRVLGPVEPPGDEVEPAPARLPFLVGRDEEIGLLAQAEALLTLATAQGFPLLVGLGICWRGWALAMRGQGEVGLAQLRQGLATFLAMGQTLSRSLCLVLLAEAAGHADQVEEGLCLLAEALTALEAIGRADMLAEVHRLRGELVLQQAVPDTAQAEACFQQALAIARRQQAKSWELRAAMSLSRLWQQQGKRTEARELLAPIYGWFTEGFDTADLQEAQALLAELA